MARSRNIKPSFFTNDLLAELSPLARLLFIGLWTIADRNGRLEDRPKRIRAEIFPYDDCDCDLLLRDLHRSGFIIRYSVDGDRFIMINNFLKHQNPHPKEQPSTIPEPAENCDAVKRYDLATDLPCKDHDEPGLLLIPSNPLIDSLQSDSPLPEPRKIASWEFEEFWKGWEGYDMPKGNKQKAQQSFLKARKVVSYEQLTTVRDQYLNQCRAYQSKSQHVATWLNQSGWEGDYTIKTIAKRGSGNFIGDAVSMALRDETYGTNYPKSLDPYGS